MEQTSTISMKRLANISNATNAIEVLKGVEDGEHVIISKHIDLVARFAILSKDIQIVYEVFSEIKDTIFKDDPKHILARQIAEFLSSFNAFVKHWETYLSKTFGDNSPNFLKFKNATHYEYDKNFAYRFLYELRNYIHHCGFPDITYTGKLNDQEERQYFLFLNKENLDIGFKWKPVLIKDFESIEKPIELLSLFEKLIDSLAKLNVTGINASLDMKKLLHASKQLATYKKLLKDDEHHLAIIEYAAFYESGSPKTLNLTVFPFDVIEHLLNNISAST